MSISIKISKSGKKFFLADSQKMAIEDAVCFSVVEYKWMKEEKISSEQFDLLHQMKLEDWTISVIPVVEKEKHEDQYKKPDSKLSPTAQLTLESIYRTLKGKCEKTNTETPDQKASTDITTPQS